MMMTPLLLLILICHAWAEVQIPPPQDVQVDSVRLTWKSPAGHQDVKYTVQLSESNPRVADQTWENVPGCVHTQLTTCNISRSKDKDQTRCARLSVRLEEGGRTSRPVQACSHGDSCSPVVTLAPSPEARSLTVHMWNNSLAYEYGAHAQYRVHYGREGEELKEYSEDLSSSVTIPGLEVGVRYCVQVQYLVYHKPYGPPSCLLCDVIPQTKMQRGIAAMIGVIVGVLVFAVFTVAMVYIILQKHEDVKKWIQSPMRLPAHYHEFLSQTFSESSQSHTSSPTEESYDVISIVPPGDTEVEESCDVISSFTLEEEEEESGSGHASISSPGTPSSAGSVDPYSSKHSLLT